MKDILKVHLRSAEVGWHNYGICTIYAYQSHLTDDPDKATCKNCLAKISKKTVSKKGIGDDAP